ncbi:MAG: hypothetical protein V1833_06585 [Elusimicrobiota bacterium]
MPVEESVMHRATARFWECYSILPKDLRRIAKRNFDFLKMNLRYPSIHFKEVGKFWSARIGIGHLALAVKDGSDFIWGLGHTTSTKG